jgi:hypothetical protein
MRSLSPLRHIPVPRGIRPSLAVGKRKRANEYPGAGGQPGPLTGYELKIIRTKTTENENFCRNQPTNNNKNSDLRCS